MPNIIQLDRHVADLIAAGEVVERPASSVKELVENSIDAGAKNITVEIQNGGMRFIRVTDDGCGMAPEDARTAFLRHATSKIRTKEDLAQIATLGFRGEALAAISSVSKIDLLTKAPHAQNGVSLHLEAGTVLSEQPVGCPDGTTIIVRDLFYNTPARMKFMKSDSAEASAVLNVVQQQALAHPQISFRLIKDGAEQLHTGGNGDLLAAIYRIFGRQLTNDMIKVDGHWEKIHVEGYITRPSATRGNRAYQNFFVNDRLVKSRLLTSALEQGYKNQMMAGRFPSCVLKISLPVQAVDVNVHPAKTEVKFLFERNVFDAVHYAVLSALGNQTERPQMQLPTNKPAETADFSQASAKSVKKDDFYQTMQAQEYLRQIRQAPSAVQKSAVSPAASNEDRPRTVLAQPVQVPAPSSAPAAKPVLKERPQISQVAPVSHAPVSSRQSTPSYDELQQQISLPEMPYTLVGEVLNTYIIVERDETIYLIDKHAAHERILFEKFKAQPQSIMPQLLLAPIPAQLGAQETAAVLEHTDALARCGFEVEDFGGDVLIRQIPSDLTLDDAQNLLQELSADLLSGKLPKPEDLRDHLLHTIACKAAIKAGWNTQAKEREHLVHEVLSRDDILYCPHGRPVCITLSKAQLEKQFRRT